MTFDWRLKKSFIKTMKGGGGRGVSSDIVADYKFSAEYSISIDGQIEHFMEMVL